MCQNVWPQIPIDEIPIESITNVHVGSWISPEMTDLYNRYLGPVWTEQPSDMDVFQRVDQIPDEELWQKRTNVAANAWSAILGGCCETESEAARRPALPN